MFFETAQLKEILLKSNYVSAIDFAEADKFAARNKTDILGYFYERDILTEDLFGKAVAEYYGTKFANLKVNHPSKEQVLVLPFTIAKELRVIIYQINDDEAIIATDKPDQAGLKDKLSAIFPRLKIDIYYALSSEIDNTFKYYRHSLNARFNKIIKEEKRITPAIVEEIVRDAIDFGTSDIHFEPQEKEVVIRFRVDGVLQEAGRVEKSLFINILNTIKVLAKLRIDDHFSAQDGSIRYQLGDRRVDLRVSITPILDGEKIVIRVLGEYVKSFNLKDIGLAERDLEILKKVAERPYGMILVTGPTGSGKTTSLYALLKLLNQPDINITTIEDPVEYKITGVNQIQVNPQTNLTFAKGLRSIVRQDPDIILVGEIRDDETAEIAVNAALTGHLLLSTFHANDAATSIPRLLDMNVEPFLLSSTLQLIISQRLVRKICDSCRRSVTVTKKELKNKIPEVSKYIPEDEFTSYEGIGCSACNNTGHKGRIALFELIQISSEIQDLILKNPSSQKILEVAKSQGAQTLFEDGINKIRNGLTTIEEVLRVAPPK